MMYRLVLLMLISAVSACLGQAADPQPSQERPLFGVLQTDESRVRSNYEAGVRVSVLSVAWSRYQPEQNRFDDAYIEQTRAKLAAFRSAGMQVVLELGMQYPPRWVRELPGSRYRNQYGDDYNEDTRSGTNGVNAVFSQAMRDLQQAYVHDVFAKLGTDFYAVRLGWGYYGELNYPDRTFNGRENCYWAYDDFAQGREAGLPPGMAPCPVPGWKPGETSPDHKSARLFAEWYMQGLQNHHDWQIATVRQAYAGRLAMMYPSWGIRPGQLDAAIAADLNGSTPAERNGETQRGFDFARFIAGVRDPGVVVYTTWIDSNPEFGDDSSADPRQWSPVHYLADCAGKHPLKLAVWGENTGRGDIKAMQLSFDRMQRFGLTCLVWAFESDLYDTSGNYASIADYARMIAAHQAK